ncbi:MAG: hypothetical protein AAF688_15875 [Bacteroidota bacterium]
MDCKHGVNTIDENFFLRLSISSSNSINNYNRYPEALAHIIVHEAVHNHQNYHFQNTTSKGFTDFLAYYNKDLKTAQTFERAAMKEQIDFLYEAAMQYYIKDRIGYKYLYNLHERERKRYNSNYPDVNNDGVFDWKDIREMMH